MEKRYDYFWARGAIQITGIVFFSQLILEVSGALNRKPGFEWVVPVCGVLFVVAILWTVVLIILNARNSV